MVHNVVPSDAQRRAFLKQLLSLEVQSNIAEYLEDPSTYFNALEILWTNSSSASKPLNCAHEYTSYQRR
jgi:hypothetical protein